VTTLTHDCRPVPYGPRLVRYYDHNGTADSRCLTLAQHTAWFQQLMAQSHEYYNQADGTNKIWRKIEVHVLDFQVPSPPDCPPNADTYCRPPNSAGIIEIVIRPFPTSGATPNRYPNALSHEVGHAHHFKTGLFEDPALLPFRYFWEREVSQNHTIYNPNYSPWLKSGGGTEDGREQYANAYRCNFGTDSTRGSSNNAQDPVLPGFRDPAACPNWRKMQLLMPETLAMAKKYGVKADSVCWYGSTDGAWGFQATNLTELNKLGRDFSRYWINGGVYIHQGGYNTWHFWDGYNWIAFSPLYVVA
jgi:hypothetical protein